MGEQGTFAVEVETLGDLAVVRVAGELDLAAAGPFEQALAGAAGSSRVVIDLGGCTFLDSGGVRAIAAAARDADGVSIVASDPAIVRVLEITGLDTMVAVHPSLDDVA